MSHWHIASFNWLEQLSSEQMNLLHASASKVHLSNGDTIFEPSSQTEFIFLLASGIVRIYRVSNEGEEVSFGFVEPGEIFGELIAYNNHPRDNFAVAVGKTILLKIPKATFLTLLQSNSSFSFTVSQQIEKRYDRAEIRIEDLIFRSAKARLARVLIQLAEDFGGKIDGVIEINFQVTQADLATLIGATRPTTSLAINDLKRDGILGNISRKIQILDLERLKKVIIDDRS